MSKDIHTEAIGSWSNQSELEKTISAGLNGPPELKREEKNRYLGQFKERVIKMLTKGQVSEPAIYPEILDALKDPRASKLIINGDIPEVFTLKYQKLARQQGKHYFLVHDPALQGKTGLIVVSKDAVEVTDISVPDRTERLEELGIPQDLILLAGKKVCQKCYNRIVQAAPEEAINYQVISWWEGLMGERCPASNAH
ncbi:protein of unknown function DUF1694 [Desulforamulus reducens MI-1]|uniref:DUF1694 domain-containing protein n=1 Tax=Desulforamulus reducens (strain ATCC BAA-1160 / DSM 100696 / MI-1) TaxID=349161 RepID=A4J1L9_DESRM|nr:YueI family protein [Desulforamulus reducens]ABO48972.1 protein of unknown function DUF1694 [Desulforamulus reducens MI-1]